MNLYEFNCRVWVHGETKAEALKELHDEVNYHFGSDNNLVALESDEGKIVESIEIVEVRENAEANA